MACGNCSTSSGSPAGCGNNGHCASGGCNKMNVYDWFADIPISFTDGFNLVEVSFKNGARKEYFRNDKYLSLHKGEFVVVDSTQGYDIGEVSLQGELVKLQMKKRKIDVSDESILNIRRLATEKDISILESNRKKEVDLMIKSRVISRKLELEMKIGDVEFQADGKKATFYYTADGRVDFRELVKEYAREFRIKIEMRQIGARQEAGRIGGIGSCGRELCCSTWLEDFKSVTTSAARYQNLAINTDKLSGQCGRLKCCLNYELDSYMEALSFFPKNGDTLKTEEATFNLRKTDIFQHLMYYENMETGKIHKLDVEDAKRVLTMNKQGSIPASISEYEEKVVEKETVEVYEDLVGHVSLKALEKKSRKKSKKSRSKKRSSNWKK